MARNLKIFFEKVYDIKLLLRTFFSVLIILIIELICSYLCA